MNTETYKERRKMWADALRSGKYQQGQGFLNQNNEKFCCLGVACEVYIENGDQLSTNTDGTVIYYDGHACGLPEGVSRWLNIHPLGDLKEPFGHTTSLAGINDNGHSFHNIAKIIESDYLIDLVPQERPKTETTMVGA